LRRDGGEGNRVLLETIARKLTESGLNELCSIGRKGKGFWKRERLEAILRITMTKEKKARGPEKQGRRSSQGEG